MSKMAIFAAHWAQFVFSGPEQNNHLILIVNGRNYVERDDLLFAR